MKKYPQLLDTALGLFYRQGFHATGVDQLAAAAGLTKKTLYRYFATKEALIDATLQQRDEHFMAALDAFVAATPLPQRPQAYLDYLGAVVRAAGFPRLPVHQRRRRVPASRRRHPPPGGGAQGPAAQLAAAMLHRCRAGRAGAAGRSSCFCWGKG